MRSILVDFIITVNLSTNKIFNKALAFQGLITLKGKSFLFCRNISVLNIHIRAPPCGFLTKTNIKNSRLENE